MGCSVPFLGTRPADLLERARVAPREPYACGAATRAVAELVGAPEENKGVTAYVQKLTKTKVRRTASRTLLLSDGYSF